MRRALSLTLAALLAACSAPTDPEEQFFGALTALCGQAFEGKVVSDDPQDADWARETLTMHVRDCAADVVRIPLHVGEDRSRTWVVSRTDAGLTLDHHHLHEDGSPDAVTLYGGTADGRGTATRQHFPVNDYSIDMFNREGLTASVTNIWTLSVTPDRFVYELRREGRHFRAEFDLKRPVATPPPAWGYEAPTTE